jgi:hypothetical protein
MMRTACALAGLIALVAPAQPTIDAVTFAQAFRAGGADQYKNRQIKGTGVNFHGAIQERIADGTTRTSLVITLGAVREGTAAPLVLKTWDEFVAAERARTTLVVALSGSGLPAPSSGAAPQTYEFSGIYDGQVRTIMRAPQAADVATPESEPCKGEQPQGNPAGSFYCAPLLVNATATITR